MKTQATKSPKDAHESKHGGKACPRCGGRGFEAAVLVRTWARFDSDLGAFGAFGDSMEDEIEHEDNPDFEITCDAKACGWTGQASELKKAQA